jgi:hypothetical protein
MPRKVPYVQCILHTALGWQQSPLTVPSPGALPTGPAQGGRRQAGFARLYDRHPSFLVTFHSTASRRQARKITRRPACMGLHSKARRRVSTRDGCTVRHALQDCTHCDLSRAIDRSVAQCRLKGVARRGTYLLTRVARVEHCVENVQAVEGEASPLAGSVLPPTLSSRRRGAVKSDAYCAAAQRFEMRSAVPSGCR